MAQQRIVIIGGGSAYVPGIVWSLAHSGEVLSESEIVLMDIDPSRLPIMSNLACRMANEAGTNQAISSTTDLTQALEGATFVLTNFRPGGLEGLRLDEQIPDRYGILGQETTGPGGTFFALRSVPQAIQLCRAVEEICPDAWVVNYVNPTNFVADAMRRETRVKCVAICDGGGNGLYYSLPKLLGVDQEAVRIRAAGLNHHSFLMELHVDGEDWYPQLLGHLRRFLASEGVTPGKRPRMDFARWMLERYGVYPANSYYLYPYFNYEQALAAFRGGNSLYNTFARDLPEHWANFEAMAKGDIPIYMDPHKHHTDVGHGDIAVKIITAIAANEPREFHVNIPNEGCITNLPQGAMVEVPALVDATGIKPMCMGTLPRAIAALLESLVAWEELTVDAALSGDRNLVIQALIAHPWVASAQVAEQMCDEMMTAHAAYLPQFQ